MKWEALVSIPGKTHPHPHPHSQCLKCEALVSIPGTHPTHSTFSSVRLLVTGPIKTQKRPLSPPGKNQSACWMMGSMTATTWTDVAAAISASVLQQRVSHSIRIVALRHYISLERRKSFYTNTNKHKIPPRPCLGGKGIVMAWGRNKYLPKTEQGPLACGWRKCYFSIT